MSHLANLQKESPQPIDHYLLLTGALSQKQISMTSYLNIEDFRASLSRCTKQVEDTRLTLNMVGCCAPLESPMIDTISAQQRYILQHSALRAPCFE